MTDWLLYGGDPYAAFGQWLPHTGLSNDQLMIAFMVPLAILGLWLSRRSSHRPSMARAVDKDRPLPKQGHPGWFEQWRYEQRMSVAGATFDRRWRHIGIVATTGARKSTLLALMADDLGVPFVVITGDHAPPLENLVRSRGGYVWKARGPLPWYPWGGDLEHAVQRAEFMHPANSTDVGVHRAGFKQAARLAWGMADQVGIPRDLDQVLAVLPRVITGQSSAAMVENWTMRLREVQQSLGDSIGAGLDLTEQLRAGRDVMFSLNSFTDPSNRHRFASIAVLEALRAADTLGNIGVLIDEVGLVGAELFGDAVRTFRVRHVTGLFASQIAADFPDEVRGNVNVWFLGQQSGGDRHSRQWASDCTFGLVPPEAFGEHQLAQGRFVVVANGRVQDAKVPTWKPRREIAPPPLWADWVDIGEPVDEPGVKNADPGGMYEVQQVEPDQEPDRADRIGWWGTLREGFRPMPLPAGRVVVPAWIASNKRRLEHFQTLSGTHDEYGQHLWTKGTNKGYGKAAYANASGWQSHFLFWAWKVEWDHEQGQPSDLDRFYERNPDVPRFVWPVVQDELVLLRALKTWMRQPDPDRPKLSLSIDHCCPGWPNALCQNWRHHQLVADEPGREGSNSKLRHERRTGSGRLAAEAR